MNFHKIHIIKKDNILEKISFKNQNLWFMLLIFSAFKRQIDLFQRHVNLPWVILCLDVRESRS